MPTKRQFILHGLYITERQGEWIKNCELWDKKLDRCDDEKLIYIRERINYLLEVRSQKYLAEMELDENNNLRI